MTCVSMVLHSAANLHINLAKKAESFTIEICQKVLKKFVGRLLYF